MPIKTPEEFKENWQKIKDKWGERTLWKNIRSLINLVDDYPDWVKEKIHGYRFNWFGKCKEINISILMVNRHPNTWDIIRPCGDYPNSDPEDLSTYQK
jgi:hypothetical protein